MDELAINSLSAINSLTVQTNKQIVSQPLDIPKQAIVVRERLTNFQRLTSYSLPTFTGSVSADDISIKGFNDELPEITNPLVEQDRNKAIEKINNLLVKINKLKDEFQFSQDSKPLCPYEQTKLEYLGPNFIVPSIDNLPEPVNFSVDAAVNSNLLINKQVHENMIMQLHLMSAEATAPNFTGNLSEVLGHAFTMLSSTANGEEVRVIDRHKTALHLEFAELVRNIPINQIIENPVIIAQKLINRYIEINKDYLKQQMLMITE